VTLASVLGHGFDAVLLREVEREHMGVVECGLEVLLDRWLVRHATSQWHASRREHDIVLWAGGAAPWRFIRFLHFATERRVLQQVGGRYRFIHVSLRDHLAETRWHASRAETESA